jgi:hypothetical protein
MREQDHLTESYRTLCHNRSTPERTLYQQATLGILRWRKIPIILYGGVGAPDASSHRLAQSRPRSEMTIYGLIQRTQCPYVDSS